MVLDNMTMLLFVKLKVNGFADDIANTKEGNNTLINEIEEYGSCANRLETNTKKAKIK